MSAQSRVQLLILVTAAATALAGAAALGQSHVTPGIWDLSTFILVAVLLDQSSTVLRVAASGSTSFVIHMAAGILFGGFWGGVVAACSTLLSESLSGRTVQKLVFNTSQRALSVLLAALAYGGLGGEMPPSYLQVGGDVSTSLIQQDLFLFFVYAATYFAVNTIAVSAVVSLSTGRPLRDVWNLNTRGVLGYDLGASALALVVAWVHTRVEHYFGIGSFGLIATVIPIVVVRHVYGLYHQLQDSGQELLQVMVKAIEARDPYTSGHSLRVCELSRTIALELGLSAKEVEQVETAALLHDVGKIHEEFAPLLRKESSLTPEETALMQTHSSRSAELVGIISKFRGYIEESVRHHHERWDGQGYPTGIAGRSIPLAARIILVSDTIDAMTTDRPYRKRLGLDVVVGELQRCKGTQFDPELVDLVISSVSVRRLIAGVVSSGADARFTPAPSSIRVSRPKVRFWGSSQGGA